MTTHTATRSSRSRVSRHDPDAAPIHRSDEDTSALAVAEAAFALLNEGPSPMTLDGRDYPTLPDRDIPLLELRGLLLARSCPRTTWDQVWGDLVRRSRDEGGAWTVACVGMAMPALVGVAKKLCAAFAGDNDDIDAAILQGFLTGLALIDLDRHTVMDRLRWHAYRCGYAAVREALEAPTPFSPAFGSMPPPPVAGHPDFVLARAVAEGALSEIDADVIGTTRLEDVTLREWAIAHSVSYPAARQIRSRAERRLVAWLTDQRADTVVTSAANRDAPRPSRVTSTGSTTSLSPSSSKSARGDSHSDWDVSRAAVSHMDAEDGLGSRSRTPSADRSLARTGELRCA